MSLRTYLLPSDQLPRAIAAGGPLADLQADPARLSRMSVVACEDTDTGQIVAYWIAWYGLHLEPLWIAPTHRTNPVVGRGLLDTMQQVVESTGEISAFCVIQEENRALIEPQASRLGFVEVPGDRLYYLVLQPADAPVRG